MSVKSLSLTLVSGIAVLAGAGCDTCSKCRDPLTATEIQNRKMEEAKNRPQAHLDNMVDNAILHDMSVADFHFIPHSAELSGTGAARLNRMSTLLDTYGGTVRYETFETDEKLVTQRLEHVREYLATTGCEMQRVDIKAMISGGRGMAADKAIIIDLKGTKASDKAATSKTTAAGISGGMAGTN